MPRPAAFLRRAPALPQGSIDELLAKAEFEAERIIAWTRIVVATSLFLVLIASAEVARDVISLDFTLWRGLHIGALTTLAFLTIGVVSLALIEARLFRPWMTWGFVSLDGLMLAISTHAALDAAFVSGNYVMALPPVFVVPILLAVGALRYRPAVQIYLTLLTCGGVLLVGLIHGMSLARPAPEDVTRFFAAPPNLIRLTMLGLTGAITVLVVLRGGRILREAIRRTTEQANLSRFLPSEMVDALRLGLGEAWRSGRRQQATVVFVDIRGSTAMAEPMDPIRLSIFISSFRRRVLLAAQAHGGLVDKFVGDGALLLFGVPEPAPDDAARAIAFGQRLLQMIVRWNAKRRFEPSLRVGIGIHTGDVFVGLVGTDERLEFTVLGDSVNVAARLEQATKEYPADLIVSAETLTAAGIDKAKWRALGELKLRGREEPTELYALPSPVSLA